MLTRLELVGFKSFADKTRLDFDPGISAIVGPNGSGKSNIVDAIRWILGEQSAKSLRGKEMADVIFNGSGTRRPHGMAEVSLYLDNTRRYLPIDGDEVVLSRRVFRGGEGEYFINGQVARLRDIRELFLGTGAGHHAYSIIEQGKVDQILQSSNKDRRYIFEEAAGISRFKARKVEALRRLERVQQNLVRVHDIHEEVERQLRSLRAQAGKARRYRELADRFKLLRLQAGSLEFDRIRDEIGRIETATGPALARLESARAQVHADESRLVDLERTITVQEESLREFTARMSALRESILTLESEVAKDQARSLELDEEVLTGLNQLAQSRQRLRESKTKLDSVRDRRAASVAERGQIADAVDAAQAAADSLADAIRRLRGDYDLVQSESRSRFQDLKRLENEQAALESQLSILWQQRQRLADDIREHTRSLDAQRREAHALALMEQAARNQLDSFVGQADAINASHRDLLRDRATLREKLAEQRQKRIETASRIDILEQLRDRHEGLDAGVRTVMAERAEGQPVWANVLGVLAEQIEVPAELADVVELALGSRAQSLVVGRIADIRDELLERGRQLPGRVQFIAIEDHQADRIVVIDEGIAWPTLASLVTCHDSLRPLVERLLGQTYLADDFSLARQTARTTVDLRFVMPSGDILEPDGSVGTGPPHKTAGILARAAEIRSLREALDHADRAVQESEHRARVLDAAIKQFEDELGQREIRRSTLAEQVRHFDSLARQAIDRALDIEKRADTHRREFDRVANEIRDVDAAFLRVERSLVSTHEGIHSTNERLAQLDASLESHQTRQSALLGELAGHRTALAVVEERLLSLRAEEAQLLTETEQRARETEDRRESLRAAEARRTHSSRRLLAERADLADLYAQKDRMSLETGVDPAELAKRREERRELSETLALLRRQVADDQEWIHRNDLRRTELRLKQETLANRIAEDYGVDLATYVPPADQRIDLPEADTAREIEDLRQKLARLGAVNADAVHELDDLERRAATFDHQINDLNVARRHLEQWIGRINEECRRLFLDSFESVRGHFQDLFRKLFGGGKADILLEDETDVLESGIEIIARPPGKEPQSISLLSGGEKTLTAVALVMAIFRSKPSPFCILDEVDAALDEANIGRFVQMLREFTTISQFILITHSKTTMAAADVLHGVTQRESGVSIRVSVRLEDVADDGQFLESGIQDDEASREPAA